MAETAPSPHKNGNAVAKARKANPATINTLVDIASLTPDEALERLGTAREGLSSEEAEERLEKFGMNMVHKEKKKNLVLEFLGLFDDPLIILLSLLALFSYFTGNVPAAAIVAFMVSVSVALRFFQELQADKAAEKLKAMVNTTCTVLRDGKKQEVPLHLIVPGDILAFSAGDLVAADVRLISAKDMFLNQASLTGESMPVEKHAAAEGGQKESPLDLINMCFMGTNVESGTALGVVVLSGSRTYFGSIAQSLSGARVKTTFDKGIKDYTWLMIRLIFVLAPVVFLINALTKHDWFEALLFALSVVVGLTPEMLPMIVNVNLAKGAQSMAAKKVIVKRLSAIQNFGAMDILCTDKTGTLTQGKIILERHLDVLGREDNDEVLKYAYLNSYYQTGLKNVLDEAVLSHVELNSALKVEKDYTKVDEITFDFVRKRMSVVVQGTTGRPLLICKGAVEEILNQCTMAEVNRGLIKLDRTHTARVKKMVNALNRDGFRVIAVGYRAVDAERKSYTIEDECELILSGFIAFLDPPKETAVQAIKKLNKHGIIVKVLTGDNELVAQSVCKQVGLKSGKTLLGHQVEAMTEEELSRVVREATIFAKLSPKHKERIINAIKSSGHIVGFMGDGINDAPALRAADVSISVDTAVDIARESSSIILLEKSLLVLEEGVLEGRKVFGNIVKYIKMAASSNFGNMLSVIGASIILPFLPMEPLQILVNNMLYDMSQTAIPTDNVDREWTEKPRRWDINQLKSFIFFIGPVSSVFDYVTFFVLLFVFNAWSDPKLFHTGWFVESLVTQTLVIHMIRTNKIPFLESKASPALILSTVLISAIGILLTLSPIAASLGFVTLPLLFWPVMLLIILGYAILSQAVKMWFIRRYGYC